MSAPLLRGRCRAANPLADLLGEAVAEVEDSAGGGATGAVTGSMAGGGGHASSSEDEAPEVFVAPARAAPSSPRAGKSRKHKARKARARAAPPPDTPPKAEQRAPGDEAAVVPVPGMGFADVARAEKRAVGFGDHPTDGDADKNTADTRSDTGAGGGDAGEADDFFGIAYNPMRRAKPGDAGYKLPSGPAFADEKAFSAELETSEVGAMAQHTAAAAGDSDGEFDFDGDAAAVDVAELARKRAEAEKQRAEAEARILEDMRREAAGHDTGGAGEGPAASAPEAAGGRVDVVAASADALRTVKAELAQAEAAERAARVAEMEATATTDLGGPLGAVGEEEEEEDDDDDDDEAPGLEDVSGDADSPGVPDDAVAREAESWAAVDALRQQEEAEASTRIGVGGRVVREGRADGRGKMIRYEEAERALLVDADHSGVRDAILVAEPDPEAGCFACLAAPASLSEADMRRRDALFCVAKTGYEDGNVVHDRVLQTLYKRLTGTDRDVPRFTDAWEDIGFQGSNPASDLRDAGMLGPLQLLWLVETYPDWVIAVMRVARDPTTEFPMAAASLSFTLLSMRALRWGRLTALANKEGSVITAANLFYAASLFEFFRAYTDSSGTIATFGPLQQRSLATSIKNPARAVSEFRRCMAKPVWSATAVRGQVGGDAGAAGGAGDNVSFSET